MTESSLFQASNGCGWLTVAPVRSRRLVRVWPFSNNILIDGVLVGCVRYEKRYYALVKSWLCSFVSSFVARYVHMTRHIESVTTPGGQEASGTRATLWPACYCARGHNDCRCIEVEVQNSNYRRSIRLIASSRCIFPACPMTMPTPCFTLVVLMVLFYMYCL